MCAHFKQHFLIILPRECVWCIYRYKTRVTIRASVVCVFVGVVFDVRNKRGNVIFRYMRANGVCVCDGMGPECRR